MVGPDRIPVANPFGVVPHPIGVDDRGAGLLADTEHSPVDMRRNAGNHICRRFAQSLSRPIVADQFVIATNSAGGDDHRIG